MKLNQRGQGVMEYLIICSLVGIVSIVMVKGFGESVKERIESMKKTIVRTIPDE